MYWLVMVMTLFAGRTERLDEALDEGARALAGRHYAEAERHFREVIAGTEGVEGDEVRLGRALGNLAATYYEAGRFIEAEPLYRRAKQVFEAARASEPRELVHVLSSYGSTCRVLGRYPEAEVLQRRALQVAERNGLEQAVMGRIWSNLARTLIEERNFPEAEALLRRAWPLRADAGVSLAELYAKTGRFHEAEVIAREVLQADSAPSASALLALAHLQRRQSKWREAERSFDRAVQAAATEQLRAAAHNGLGALYYARHQYAKAAAQFTQATSWSAGVEVRSVALENRGNALHALHRNSEAAASYESALAAREAAYGADSPALADTLQTVGLFYACIHHTEEAVRLLLRAGDLWGRDARCSNLEVAAKLQTIAAVLRRAQHYAEAARVDARMTAIQVRHGLLQ